MRRSMSTGPMEQIRALLTALAQAPLPADPTASLFENGVIDSFGVMELVDRLERMFGIKVPRADMLPRRFESLEKIAAYVEARRGAHPGAAKQ